MANYNKQAVEVKNSNLSARTIEILVVLGAIVFSTLLLIFAPDALLFFGKIAAAIVLVALAVSIVFISFVPGFYEGGE